MDNNLLVIRQAQCGQRDSKSSGSRQKRERIHDRKRIHGDMDIRQHAFPGDAERFRYVMGGAGGLPPAAPSFPDGKARQDGYGMESRYQCGTPVEGDSQGVRRVRHHHCGNRRFP